MRFVSDSDLRISVLYQVEGRLDGNPEGESDRCPIRPYFDRRLNLAFHGSRVTSDAGLLAYRELDDALELTASASDAICDHCTGKNGWHGVIGLLR